MINFIKHKARQTVRYFDSAEAAYEAVKMLAVLTFAAFVFYLLAM